MYVPTAHAVAHQLSPQKSTSATDQTPTTSASVSQASGSHQASGQPSGTRTSVTEIPTTQARKATSAPTVVAAAAPPTTVDNHAAIHDVNPPRAVPATIVEKKITKHVEPGTSHKVQVATVLTDTHEQSKGDRSTDRGSGKEATPSTSQQPSTPAKSTQPTKLDSTSTKADSTDTSKSVSESSTKESRLRHSHESHNDQIATSGAGSSFAILATPANVRGGPGGSYRPFATLPRGTSVQVLATENGWVKVRADGKVGYVYSSLVNLGHGSHHSTTSESASTPTEASSSEHKSSSHHHHSHSESRHESHHDRSSHSQHSSKSSSTNAPPPEFVP